MDNIEALVNERAKAKIEQTVPQEEAVSVPATATPAAPAFHDGDGSSYQEQAKKAVGALATQKAVEDELLVRSITNNKKEELLHHSSAELKKEQAESMMADVALQQADYGVNSGVAAYAGIKKPLPRKMQTILFTTLSVFQLIFLILIGLPISLVNIIADSVDSVVAKLAAVTKSARWIVLAVLCVGAIIIIVYLIKFLLIRFGIIS